MVRAAPRDPTHEPGCESGRRARVRHRPTTADPASDRSRAATRTPVARSACDAMTHVERRPSSRHAYQAPSGVSAHWTPRGPFRFGRLPVPVRRGTPRSAPRCVRRGGFRGGRNAAPGEASMGPWGGRQIRSRHSSLARPTRLGRARRARRGRRPPISRRPPPAGPPCGPVCPPDSWRATPGSRRRQAWARWARPSLTRAGGHRTGFRERRSTTLPSSHRYPGG